MTKMTLVLDFDGVIHSYDSGWKGADQIPDPPVPGALAFLMKGWLWRHLNETYEADGDAVFQHIEWPTHKPAAFVTIDDRALTFDGTWPDIGALKAFKPWNKK